ncbi:MAG: hypothetical protein F4052_06400 [Dehalococcoidia bacterium]|nr:hypothetical protein [Dehalococcoidia bacterium]MYK26563.1 hypothetical protein [Dehalococcoidia bacterium]
MAEGEPTEGPITAEMRAAAQALGWEEDLLDRAIDWGYSPRTVVSALGTKLAPSQAKSFLDREPLKPDLTWMDAPTEWGVRAEQADADMGLTVGDIMVGSYGEIPDLWTDRTEIARGSNPQVGQEDMGYTIFEKAVVWTDSVADLYERAIRDRWAPATDLGWRSLEALPDEVEKAICQVMTEHSERAYAEAAVLGRWLPEISYGFVEMKLFMSSVIYDLARHAEAFRKRALSNGGGLGLQAPTDLIRGATEARTYPELMAYLFVQDSAFLTFFRQAGDIAQNQLERDLYALVASDRERLMEYQVERFEAFLLAMPDRREEQQRYLAKAEVRLAREWNDPAVREPLILLLGGSRENAAVGEAALTVLRRRQVEEYLGHLDQAGFIRSRLHSGLAVYLDEPETAPA